MLNTYNGDLILKFEMPSNVVSWINYGNRISIAVFYIYYFVEMFFKIYVSKKWWFSYSLETSVQMFKHKTCHT